MREECGVEALNQAAVGYIDAAVQELCDNFGAEAAAGFLYRSADMVTALIKPGSIDLAAMLQRKK